MQFPWHLIYFDELLIMCCVGITSVKINNWIINTKIQSWIFFPSLQGQYVLKIIGSLLLACFSFFLLSPWFPS